MLCNNASQIIERPGMLSRQPLCSARAAPALCREQHRTARCRQAGQMRLCSRGPCLPVAAAPPAAWALTPRMLWAAHSQTAGKCPGGGPPLRRSERRAERAEGRGGAGRGRCPPGSQNRTVRCPEAARMWLSLAGSPRAMPGQQRRGQAGPREPRTPKQGTPCQAARVPLGNSEREPQPTPRNTPH